MRVWTRLGVLLLVTFYSLPATAHDFAPPAWRLGGPYATLQGWDFLVPQPNGIYLPDHPNLPLVTGNGLPTSPIPTASITSMSWVPYDGSGAVTPIPNVSGGVVNLTIPNWIDSEPEKWIRIQVTYVGNQPPSIGGANGWDSEQVSILFDTPALQPIDPFNGIYGWIQDIKMYPNPDWEEIRIVVPPDVLIDQIIVDTISIPEPASTAVLVATGLLLIGRGRRR